MKVILKSMTLTNFRGVRTLTINFDNETTIFGDNRTGKTTIYNAFLWLFFGKDNQDRKDFEIKTLGSDNKPISRLDHEVSAVVLIDGVPTNLKRTYREKWVKKKGNTIAEFSGHETLLFWNDVPMKLEDYQAKISAILKENVFKMITSTDYFNNQMKWQERRSVLLTLAGNMEDRDLLRDLNEKGSGKYEDLIRLLGASKTLEELGREIANKKRKIKEEIILIPSRIDEAKRSLPDPVDYDQILSEIDIYTDRLSTIDEELMSKTTAQKARQTELQAKINKVGDLKISLSGIEYHTKDAVKNKRQLRESGIADTKRNILSLTESITRNGSDILSAEKQRSNFAAQKDELTAKWHTINKESLVFDPEKFSCPTCKRAYEESGIEEKKTAMIKNFNQSKSSRLSEIVASGKKIAGEIEVLTKKIEGFTSKRQSLQIELEQEKTTLSSLTETHNSLISDEEKQVVNDLSSNTQYQTIKADILALQEEISAPQDLDENQGLLIVQKRELVSKIAELNKELNTKTLRDNTLLRIAELTASESKMAQDLALLEQTEFNIYEFDRAKMDEVESRINDKFRVVKFKMFREQVNGGQEPCCDTLIDGVPFGVANTGSQINAGLDIINVMSDHFDIHAPVFVDNRESIVTLIPSGSQIINLVVVPGAILSVNEIEYRKDYKKRNVVV